MKKEAFTLLELVVVIIILGVLATQYARMVEKGRYAEARQILGDLRKLAIAYRLANGTITGITNADVNIGTAADQVPSSCRSSHYFWYYVSGATADPLFVALAGRCTSGGKPPQGPTVTGYEDRLYLWSNLTTGADTWAGCVGTGCSISTPPPY